MTENKNPAELLQERDKIFYDFYTNTVPERMPVMASISSGALSVYCGIDPFEWHHNATVLLPCMEEVAKKLYSDTCPFTPPVLIMRPATPYQILGSQSFKLASNAQVQHPEVIGMLEDEYPELIEKGFDFLVEKVIPRQYKNMGLEDPAKMAYTAMMQNAIFNNEMAAFMPGYMAFNGKMGYHFGGGMGSGGFAEAPFDFLADQLRSFSQISMDVRRRRPQVAEACEVLTPIMYKMGRPAYVDYQANIFYPLHMPTFMREKDFVELWLPTYKRIMEQDAAHGIRPFIFLEDDWTRYLDIVQDQFPAGCVLGIEKGDPKTFKDKLGKKFILDGMFQFENMRLYKGEDLKDRAKEFLDIMLPGCGYLFGFDRNPLLASDMDLDEYCMLMECVRDYSHYDNAGEKYGTPLNVEGFKADPSFDAPLKSRIMFDWDTYKKENPYAPDSSRGVLEAGNAQVFSWYINLLA